MKIRSGRGILIYSAGQGLNGLTKMAAMPIYGKNLQKSSLPEQRMPWGCIFAQIIGDERSTKVAKIIVVH